MTLSHIYIIYFEHIYALLFFGVSFLCVSLTPSLQVLSSAWNILRKERSLGDRNVELPCYLLPGSILKWVVLWNMGDDCPKVIQTEDTKLQTGMFCLERNLVPVKAPLPQDPAQRAMKENPHRGLHSKAWPNTAHSTCMWPSSRRVPSCSQGSSLSSTDGRRQLPSTN